MASFPVLTGINELLRNITSFEKRYFVQTIKLKMGVVVAEYECSQYFDWKIQCMNVIRYEIPDSKHASSKRSSSCFDWFVSNTDKSKGHFLLDVTGLVTSNVLISAPNIPDVFQQAVRSSLGSIKRYVRITIQTHGGRVFHLYGDGSHISPVISGLHYTMNAIECTITEPFTGWITKLSKATVSAIEEKDITYGLSEVPHASEVREVVMWDVVDKPTADFYVIKARILKLIKLELFIKDHTTSQHGPQTLSAKLVLSMDDSSCGFLGIAYDHIVAYILGINKETWTQIRDVIIESGPIRLGLEDETECPISRLLRRVFRKTSLQSNQEMVVKPLQDNRYGSMEGRQVPFRACVDIEKKQWATFHTRTHKSISVKVVNVRI